MRILSSTSKPLTSPGRTEKFPPPLMRFLRSNVGSRSRGRTTKSNLLFMRRKKAITSSSSNNGIETQEPSSPKVTCIGQVRVRRSRSSKSRRKTGTNNNNNDNNNNNNNDKKDSGKSCKCSCCCCRCSCCCWFQKPTFCGLKLWRKPSCGKWFSFFNCRSVKVRTDSSKYGSNRFEPSVAAEATTTLSVMSSLPAAETDTESATAHSLTTPPKNALLLTRCRSAPYRSSSLVCQIWGEKSEEEAETRALGNELISSRSSSDSSNVSVSVSVSARDSTSKSRGNHDVGNCARISLRKDDLGNCDDYEHKQMSCCTTDENIVNGSNSKEVKVNDGEEEDEDGKFSSRKSLMVLMRSKSEPRRSDREKYDPESSEFWKHRRSTPHSHADAVVD